MAPDTHWPMWELLMRHGVDWSQARSLSIVDFRHWDLKDVESVFSKIKRPSPEYRYFTSDEVKPTRLPANKEERGPFQKWWPSLWDTPARGISPPRPMVEQSARDGTVLCVNVKGEWSLRTDGYVALSHVWIEGLQREEKYQGLEKTKVIKVFELLARAGLESEWIWTDVLVIPGGGVPTSSLEDELLTVDLINTMPRVYSQAEAVLVIDALVIQLHSTDLLDVAVGLACGKWATRVWTYQEIKLASRAVVVTATGGVEFSDMIKYLKDHEAINQPKYRALYLWAAIMAKSDQYRLTIRDLVTACGSRNSGMDIDYARAFFPVLGLKWTNGMSREEGMQMIYHSLPQDTTVIAAFAGSPRMKLDPGWAPSYLTGLEGRGGNDLRWEKRGIRGEWFVLRITKLLGTTQPKHGRIGLNLEVDCNLHPTVQCITSRNEYPEAIEAVKAAISKGSGYILSVNTFATYSKEWARSVLVAEKAITREEHGLEVAVHCAATIGSPGEHQEEKVSLLIRHCNPNVDLDLPNQLRYHWFCEEETSRSHDLPQEEGETPMHVAVRKGDVTAVRSLLKDRDLINTCDHRGFTPIHTAAARGATEILEILVEDSTNIEVPAKDSSNDTPLVLAARRGQAESITVLLEHGANIENRNGGEYTPLMVASYECHNEAVATLLERGADPNSRDTRGFSGSPLLLASGRNGLGVETMKLLVQFSAEVNPVFHPLGWTPLLKAADMGNDNEVEYLLSVDANPNVKDTSNRTPLRHAIHHAREHSVRMLLDAGADREAIFDNDLRPVHLAATCGNYEIMQMLLESRVPIEVNVRASEDLKRVTPLHMAVEKKQPTVVKLLISKGAEVNAKDAAGDGPLDYALAGGHDGIRAILIAAGGKIK